MKSPGQPLPVGQLLLPRADLPGCVESISSVSQGSPCPALGGVRERDSLCLQGLRPATQSTWRSGWVSRHEWVLGGWRERPRNRALWGRAQLGTRGSWRAGAKRPKTGNSRTGRNWGSHGLSSAGRLPGGAGKAMAEPGAGEWGETVGQGLAERTHPASRQPPGKALLVAPASAPPVPHRDDGVRVPANADPLQGHCRGHCVRQRELSDL